ncbi:hypothetical protein PR048_021772 [Dryococelus australis]|uniref:Uncharacterized protein n=1 Tax=Dryococelus australis TaxID=614101 RepID=A0ABQ9GZ48_9NEOP|nr:hypothetical protein PR048_021772 [Dryococelus australis]
MGVAEERVFVPRTLECRPPPSDQLRKTFNRISLSMLASYQDKPGSIPGRVTPGFSHVGIVPDDDAGRSPVSPALLFQRCSILIGSQDLAIKSRPNLFLQSLIPAIRYKAANLEWVWKWRSRSVDRSTPMDHLAKHVIWAKGVVAREHTHQTDQSVGWKVPRDTRRRRYAACESAWIPLAQHDGGRQAGWDGQRSLDPLRRTQTSGLTQEDLGRGCEKNCNTATCLPHQTAPDNPTTVRHPVEYSNLPVTLFNVPMLAVVDIPPTCHFWHH